MRYLRFILDVLGWLQIVAGATILSGLSGLLIYVVWPGDTGRLVAIILVIAGFLSGCIWATRIWIKHGTVAWLSRIRKVS